MKAYQVYHIYEYEDYDDDCYSYTASGEDPVGPIFASRDDAEEFVKRYAKPHIDPFFELPVGALEVRELNILDPGEDYNFDESDAWWLDPKANFRP